MDNADLTAITADTGTLIGTATVGGGYIYDNGTGLMPSRSIEDWAVRDKKEAIGGEAILDNAALLEALKQAKEEEPKRRPIAVRGSGMFGDLSIADE